MGGLLLWLMSCAYLADDNGPFRDRATNYQQAHLETPLLVPDEVRAEPYVLSAITLPITFVGYESLSSIAPPKPYVAGDFVNQEYVQMNILGDQQWLLVAATPGQVWPQLRSFLNDSQLTLSRADTVHGVLETITLQPANEPALKERYQLRIEQGVQPGTSEVYVIQARFTDEFIAWPAQSSDRERETIMLEAIANYLTSDSIDTAASSPVSMLAQQTLSSIGKATLMQPPNAKPYIILQLPFDRAWLSLGQALENAGFDIEDKNYSEHLYYVRLTQPVQKKKGLTRLFSSRKRPIDNLVGTAYAIDVHQSSPGAMIITVDRQNNTSMSSNEEITLLNRIKAYLQ